MSQALAVHHELDFLPARSDGRFGMLLGASPPMLDVYAKLARVAPTDASVVLTGECGTGKERAARTLHRLSARSAGPFLPFDCHAFAPAAMEGELFGRGRTGTGDGDGHRHRGYVERADGGTLYLGEVAEMPLELQAKLLRVLETAVLTPLGGDQEVEVDVRVVAATSCDLRDAVANGRLRETLLHRLAIFPIAMPPLRERGDDVELLAEHFLADLADGTGGSKSFTAEAVERLRSHPWPGNVRELKSAVHHAFILAEDDGIGPAALPEEIGGRSSGGRSVHFRVGVSIAEVERELMLATLRYHDGNKRKTAEVLGVSLKTLYNRLNAYKDGAN